MHTQAQGILSLPVWAAGHAQENVSGRPGASDDKPRTCAHATQEQPEPALAKKNRSAEISWSALPLGPPFCALTSEEHAAWTNLHSSEGQTRRKPASNQTPILNVAAPKYNKRGQIRRKGKDRDGFLTAAADC